MARATGYRNSEDIGLIHKDERYGFWMAAFAGESSDLVSYPGGIDASFHSAASPSYLSLSLASKISRQMRSPDGDTLHLTGYRGKSGRKSWDRGDKQYQTNVHLEILPEQFTFKRGADAFEASEASLKKINKLILCLIYHSTIKNFNRRETNNSIRSNKFQ